MRWRTCGVALVLIALIACTASPTPFPSPSRPSAGPSPSATPSPALTPAFPTPSWAATPTLRPTPSPETTGPPAGAIGLDWALIRRERWVGPGAIAVGPGGWVHLVARDGEIPNTPDVIWSPDLRSWSVVTPPGDVVACGDGGALAASDSTWLLSCGGLFNSIDGRIWKTVRASGSQLVPVRQLRHIVSDGRTFVAYQGEYPADTSLWRSEDGSSWTAVTLPGAPVVRVDALIARHTGGFVLAGRVAGSAEELREAHDMQWYSLPGTEAIWTSTDGSAWTALELGSAFDGGRITGLAADGPGGGLVAVGYLGENLEDGVNQRSAVWRSSDFRAWQLLEGAAFDVVVPYIGDIRVAATAERWLLVAARPSEDAGSQSGMTQVGVTAGSDDGTTWWAIKPIMLRADTYGIDAIVGTRNRLVILGQITPPGSGLFRTDTMIWTSPPLE